MVAAILGPAGVYRARALKHRHAANLSDDRTSSSSGGRSESSVFAMAGGSSLPEPANLNRDDFAGSRKEVQLPMLHYPSDERECMNVAGHATVNALKTRVQPCEGLLDIRVAPTSKWPEMAKLAYSLYKTS